MPDEHRHGLLGRVADRVEDAVEAVAGGVAAAADLVEDAVEGVFTRDKHHHHHHHHEHHGCCCCGCGAEGGSSHGGSSGGPPGRPKHQTGGSTGALGGLDGGDLGLGPVLGALGSGLGTWTGTRDQMYLPFLLIRANAADLGARPITGVTWESPDILIEPGVAPSAAPPMPTTLGGIAKAGQDNTIYAHVWNLGKAPVADALVEFYWFNPALGFSDADANLIGYRHVSLGGRGQAGSHRLVKCPVSWVAQFLNGGHECLVVRVSQASSDPLSGPAWDPGQNRHVGQRNIHVMSAAEAAAMPTLPIGIGPLFGGTATIEVARHDPATMPWLHLVTMDRAQTFAAAQATGDVGITAPTPAGTPVPNLGGVPDPRGVGLMGDSHAVTGDGQQVAFHATDGGAGNGEAHVYRVTGTQDGVVFGGYTVVVLGDH